MSNPTIINLRANLLVVEDSNEDFEAFERFLNRWQISSEQKTLLKISVHRCLNGNQALAFLYRTGSYINPNSSPRPKVILLDLNLPGIDGREVLRRIKQDEELKSIPVVVFTTSDNPKDIEICYRQGANSYIIKSINFAQLKQNIQIFLDYWFKVSELVYESPSNKQS